MKNRNCYKQYVAKAILLILGIAGTFSFLGCAAKQHIPVEEKPAYFNELLPAAKHISASLSRQLKTKTDGSTLQIVVDVFFNELSAEVSIAGRSLQPSVSMKVRHQPLE